MKENSDMQETTTAADGGGVADLIARLERAEGANALMQSTLRLIAARDFNCAPHQHGMAAASAAGATLAALRAPQPEGEGVEVVTLGLMLSTRSPNPHYMACAEPEQEDPRFWMHVGNLTFTPLSKPAIPTIPALALCIASLRARSATP